MSDKNKSNSSISKTVLKKDGRGLPTTGTKTPMPAVKPPKPAESSKKS